MDAYVPFCAPFLTDLRDRGPFTHISDYYPKMSYVTYERWEPMIPQTGDKAEKFLDFILANDKTKYNGETQGEKRPFPLARRSWLRPVKQTKRDAQEKEDTRCGCPPSFCFHLTVTWLLFPDRCSVH